MADYDILSAAVTLLVGFLIFLTLGWRYPAIYYKWKAIDSKGRLTRAYGVIGWLLFLMVLTATISAGFSLLVSTEILSDFSAGRDVAIIFLIISLAFLSTFTWRILQESPSHEKST